MSCHLRKAWECDICGYQTLYKPRRYDGTIRNNHDLDKTIGFAMICYGGKDLCRPCLEKVVYIQWAADREKRRKAYEGQSEKADPAAQEAAGR